MPDRRRRLDRMPYRSGCRLLAFSTPSTPVREILASPLPNGGLDRIHQLADLRLREPMSDVVLRARDAS